MWQHLMKHFHQKSFAHQIDIIIHRLGPPDFDQKWAGEQQKHPYDLSPCKKHSTYCIYSNKSSAHLIALQ